MSPRWPGRRALWTVLRVVWYVAPVLLLLWVFHGINPEKLWAEVRDMSWPWLFGAFVVHFASYVLEGLRWSILVRPLGSLPVVRATEAGYIRLLTNQFLPMRAGEVVRAFLGARWLEVPIVEIVPSVLIERLLDALWIVPSAGLALLLVPLPSRLVRDEKILLGVLLVGLGLFAWLFALGRKWQREGDIPADRRGLKASVARATRRVAVGIRQIGLSLRLAGAALAALGFLFLQFAAIWLLMFAYRLDIGFGHAVVVFLILAIGTAIPNTPSNVGSFQFFLVLGLTLIGVGKTEATGFSLVAFALVTLPVWAFGMVSLHTAGLTLGDLRRIVRERRRSRQG